MRTVEDPKRPEVAGSNWTREERYGWIFFGRVKLVACCRYKHCEDDWKEAQEPSGCWSSRGRHIHSWKTGYDGEGLHIHVTVLSCFPRHSDSTLWL